MPVGYARVSTMDRDPALHRDRPGLRAALDFLREGGTLVVWKLSRLARYRAGDQDRRRARTARHRAQGPVEEHRHGHAGGSSPKRPPERTATGTGSGPRSTSCEGGTLVVWKLSRLRTDRDLLDPAKKYLRSIH